MWVVGFLLHGLIQENLLNLLLYLHIVWNIKFTAIWIFESTIVVSSFLIYFSSSFFSSASRALESPCCFCLKKNMLDGANPFDTIHEVQTAYFKTLGTPATLLHLHDLQMLFGFKQEKHILPFSIFSQQSRGLRLKNSAQVLTS